MSFGTIFKDIQLIKYNADTLEEISRINVPLTYAGKEDFLTRLLTNPDLHKQTQIDLPRMSFEFTNIAYDKTRKLSSYLTTTNRISGSEAAQQYAGVPYDMDFQLQIYVRNVEDGTQIVEQILPYFNPDYTLSMSFVDEMNITRDIPIILESVKYDPAYEGVAETTVRVLIWTLEFKMKTYFFGPISNASLITQATGNVHFSSGGSGAEEITLKLNSGFGDYKIGEYVYQGSNLADATSRAKVVSWDNVGNILVVTQEQGNLLNFSQNLIGSITKSNHGIISYYPEIGTGESIVVTPNPPTPNVGEDFGFTVTITEF
jgi:hypothetical protein